MPKDLNALEVIETTRSIRRFRRDAVSNEDLAKVLYAASRAPSGANQQPFRFIVLRRDDEGPARAARHILRDAFRGRWEGKRKRDGFTSGSGADPRSPKSRAAKAMQHLLDEFDEVPVIVLACLIRARAPYPREGASVYPACQNLLLAARAIGLGGTMMLWHDEVEAPVKQVLGVPADVTVAATLLLGVPEGSHGPLRRRPLAELVYDGAWDRTPGWALEPTGARFTWHRSSRQP